MPKNKTVITFNEGVRGAPQPIRAWFYPGANWGEEFVYPKAKAVELAKVTKAPVLALQAEVPVEVEKPEEEVVVTQLQAAPIIAVRPTGEEVEVAQVVQSEPTPTPTPTATVAAAPTTEVAENKLPGTASSLPLVLLCGLLALGGAFGVRAIAKSRPLVRSVTRRVILWRAQGRMSSNEDRATAKTIPGFKESEHATESRAAFSAAAS